MARLFVVGRGLGAHLLWKIVGPEVDLLSPENVPFFTNSSLTATVYHTSNRFSVTTKSPLIGTVLDASSGGFWGMQFKKASYYKNGSTIVSLNRRLGSLPKIGIRPTIDGWRQSVNESLEEQTMSMARGRRTLTTNLRYPIGWPVDCVITDTAIDGVVEAAAFAEKFARYIEMDQHSSQVCSNLTEIWGIPP
jgi:hypothetical protein